MKLVIERKTWLRGGQFGSRLMVGQGRPSHPSIGKKCCLGFFALACGYTPEQIMDRGTPWSMFADSESSKGMAVPHIPVFTEYLIHKFGARTEAGLDNTDLARELMKVNDHPYITDAQRERELTVLFAQMNVEVEFVDEVSA